MDTNDCKEKIYKILLLNDYYNLDFNVKKELIKDELRKYIIDKIDSYYGFKNVCEHYETDELINYLSDSPCIVPLIKFLIYIMCENQNSTIYWIENKNKKEIEVNYTNNYLVSIYSGNNYSYIFNYLLDYYLNKFQVNKKHIRQL